MILLAIDTSTDQLSVGLTVRGEFNHREQQQPRQQAQMVLPLIEELLAEAQLKPSQLDAIAYGRGPGSFTGLRIACAVAKGLAYAHDLPLFPVSSLATIADNVFHQVKEKSSHVLAMIDARMNQLYWGCFSYDQHDVPESVTSAACVDVLSTVPLMFAGVGFEPYVHDLPHSIQQRMVKQRSIYPEAEAMTRLVMSGRIPKISAADALPVYIRNQITQGEPRG